MNNGQAIELPPNMSVRELAQMLGISPIDVIKALMNNGVMASINQVIDYDTAAIVAEELGFETHPIVVEEEEEEATGDIPLWRRIIADEPESALQPRPPVVTMLGHVDHGKTTLLDAIRQTNRAAEEAGGITQHIGAYQVEHNGRWITFLDTPGHAAFTAMRARGAQGADIVVLVVAADDGVMPQTKEAINHARAARVPIVVALNKIDRPNANPERVKKQLADLGLVPDDWDGDTLVVPVSAKMGQGIEDLLEAILLVADQIDIRANPKGRVIGTVIEARRDRARGVLATLLVQNGTLSQGQVVVAGTAYGRVRAMFDFQGKPLRKAGPSVPVEVMGLNDVPEAGTLFEIVPNERTARQLVAERLEAEKQRAQARRARVSLEKLFEDVQAGEVKELRLVVKADVQGSLDPILSSLEDLSTDEIKIKVLHAEAGNIGENDVMLAAASHAIVVGFNVQVDPAARKASEVHQVDIRLYDIIYRLTEDIEKAVKGMFGPEEAENVIGKADVLAVFRVPRVGKVAGCRVREGVIRRNGMVRVYRNGEVVFEGELASLKHEKDDVREVRQGFECGLAVKGGFDFEVGDQIECFVHEIVEVA